MPHLGRLAKRVRCTADRLGLAFVLDRRATRHANRGTACRRRRCAPRAGCSAGIGSRRALLATASALFLIASAAAPVAAVAAPATATRAGAPAVSLPVGVRAGSPAASPATSPVAPGAVPDLRPEWVQVLGDGDAGVELLLRAPEPRRDAGTLRVPGFDGVGEPGLPRLYEADLVLGVPGPGGARLVVLEETRRDLGRIEPDILPAPRTRAERRADEAAGKPVQEWQDVEAKPLTALYPENAVEVTGATPLRGRYVVSVRFRPLQHRPDGGASYFDAVRLRLEFRDRPRLRAGIESAAALDPVHAVLLNAGTASRWVLAGAPAAHPRAAERVNAVPLERLRIRITQRGIYQLGYNDLKSAGVPVDENGFDPRTLRLYFDSWRPVVMFADSTPASWQESWEMSQADVWVDGEQDGSFDAGDRLVFYALGPAGYEDLAGYGADFLTHARHPYDRSLYAWLVWGGEQGARMDSASVAAPGAPDDSLVTSVLHREHFEEDQQFDRVDDLWYWQEIWANHPGRVEFNLDLGGQTTATGTLRLGLGYSLSSLQSVRVVLNGVDLGQVDWFQPGGTVHWLTFDNVTLRGGANPNVLQINAVLPNGHTQLLKLDVTWQRPLAAKAAGVLSWTHLPPRAAKTGAPRRAGSTLAVPVYELGGFASAPLVFDASDWLQPVRLVDATRFDTGGVHWRVRHGSTGAERHCIAVASPTTFVSRDLALRQVAPLRQRTSSPDMLIVTHGPEDGSQLDLRAAAERLAAHRRNHWPDGGTPDILVATTRDIYENFSGGRLDPLAVRNYIKFLYRLSPAGESPRLRYVLLLGDATNDPRQLLRGTVPTLVPTLQPWYADVRFGAEYAVEDWLAEMDTPQNNSIPDTPTQTTRFAVPDVALGRLAARSSSEALRLVDKVIAYETQSGYGAWRARVVMAADDDCTPRGCGETFHEDNSEALLRYVPRDADVVKIYLTEYPAVLGQKPQGRAAFIRTWSDGCLLVNYQGHGAPRQLADEVLLLSSDIPSLTNGSRLPIFLPISCSVSAFDEPEQQSMCEDLLSSPVGGAIATEGATNPTFVTSNFTMNVGLFQQAFPGRAFRRVPVGLVHQLSKVLGASGSGGQNQSYVLLGDPSMPLQEPLGQVRFTSGPDTLFAGRRSTITGRVFQDGVAVDDFEGHADVEVFGQADTTGYRGNGVYIPYFLVGAPIYRGTVLVHDGTFAFEFMVPLGVRLGGRGRVSAYAYRAQGDAKGALDAVDVIQGSGEDSSSAAPRITLRFPDDRTCVKAGTLLIGEIRDENGINIQGTSGRSTIYLDFDRKNEPLNVTSRFRYQDGSFSFGSVSVPLPSDLEPGSHSATLIASDNVLNTSTASLDFEVVGEQAVRLVNVIAFPNPFRDRTHFFFEITDPAEVEVRIFTTSGREVWHQTQRFDAGTRGSIKWDGMDFLEDRLANGTYLYRLEARPLRPGVPTLEHTGKVVIMR